MSFVDINIFLFPSLNIVDEYKHIENSLKAQLSKALTFEQCVNIPHLSLYQLSVHPTSIERIKEALSTITVSLPTFKMNETLNIKGQNVFWSSDDALTLDSLINFHTSVVDRFKSFRAEKPLTQLQDACDALSPKEQELVKQYGVYWGVPGFFDPHLTVVYNFSDPCDLLPPLLSEVKISNIDLHASSIGLARIGFHGNIEEILFTTPLEGC